MGIEVAKIQNEKPLSKEYTFALISPYQYQTPYIGVSLYGYVSF